MAKQEQNGEPNAGFLEVPGEPDTSPQSMSAAVLEEIQNEPPKRKPGRPKKPPVVAVVDDEDESAPPEHLMEEPTEPDPAPTEEGEDGEESSLETELNSLAEDLGVDPQLFQGAESIGEAKRLYRTFAQLMSRDNSQESYDQPPRQPSRPAASADQKTDEDAFDLDLSEYDDDEPIKKTLTKLVGAVKERDKRLAQLERERTQEREAEFTRLQQQYSSELAEEFARLNPEVFGSAKQRTNRQQDNLMRAFRMANTMVQNTAGQGWQMPLPRSLANMAYAASFPEEMVDQRITAKRAAVQKGQARRSVGGTARMASAPRTTSNGKVFEGPMSEDPDILGAVRSVLTRTRG